MNSRLLKTHLPVKVIICLPFIFVVCCRVQSFYPCCSYPILLFLLIKTYIVSSCVSLAPAI